jgi:hypothetical protein
VTRFAVFHTADDANPDGRERLYVLWRAQLSEVRGEMKTLKRSVPQAAEAGLRRAGEAEASAAAAHAHAEELGRAVASQRGDTASLRERVDVLAHGADAGLRAVDGKVERFKSQVRGAKAAARMAEARAVALAGEVGRVARHVGIEGVGDALRTAVLFAPPPQGYPPSVAAEDDDLLKLYAMRDGTGGAGGFTGLEAGVAGDAAPPMAPPSPERVARPSLPTAHAFSRSQVTPTSQQRRVTWEVHGGDL